MPPPGHSRHLWSIASFPDYSASSIVNNGDNPSGFKGDDRPVDSVTWDEARNFAKALTAHAGKGGRTFRLPTEAEWEYACRGGANSKNSKPFHLKDGSSMTLSTDQANYNGEFPYNNGPKGENRATTIPVGSLRNPNRYGLHDMHGNLWEWCLDYYGPVLLGGKDPVRTTKFDEERRVLRGGSWDYYGNSCRAADRGHAAPDGRYLSYGFRIVMLP